MLKLLRSYKRRNDISCVVVMVACHTYDWIVPCLTNLRKFLPHVDVLVVNNNPHLNDNPVRSRSFQGTTGHGTPIYWSPYFESENLWLAKQDFAKVIYTPTFQTHAGAVDFAIQSLYGYDAFVHIEPDCTITGDKWFRDLQKRLVEGFWMASGFVYPSHELHPTPTIWKLDVFRYLDLSFESIPRDLSEQEDAFYTLVDVDQINLHCHQTSWDTGMLAAYKCARKNRASWISTRDFRHHFRGSARNIPDHCKKAR